ncbi:COX15/CtaA family protein [Mucisphaera sp.]|uniref:COX15/CtaA family protein n=1 Tax=Mucisphaera sp. TaxID=2913024 RepID=UPI003D13BBA0
MNAKDADSPYRAPYRRTLHALAILLALSTFTLIGFGGHVTSLDAGLAVPDWPGTFGYNMFLAPLEVWFYDVGTFWEHAHRLIGSWVGFLTLLLGTGLAIWAPKPWLRWLGIPMIILVIIQGLMGGFRVTEESQILAAVHGVVGQVFFAIVIFVIVATGGLWTRATIREKAKRTLGGRLTTYACWSVVAVLFVQLALGASIRHFDAERAIPDAPLSYGSLVPPMNQQQLDTAILNLPENLIDRVPIDTTAGKVHLHFTHRAWAIVVILVTALAGWLVLTQMAGRGEVLVPLINVVALMAAQVMLGIMTVWAEIHPTFATMHQSLGALLLAATVWLACRAHIVWASEPAQVTIKHITPPSNTPKGGSPQPSEVNGQTQSQPVPVGSTA